MPDKKTVSFNSDVKINYAFSDDDYDRTCIDVDKITFRGSSIVLKVLDMCELYELKGEMKRQYEKMHAQWVA